MTYAFLIAMAYVMIGALNWGLVGAFRFNLVETLLGKGMLTRGYYIITGISALYLMFRRNTYLPFLGETALPCSLVHEHVPDHADTEVSIHGLQPGSKILYWATEAATQGLSTIKTWQQAYLEFANAGVAVVDAGGRVSLRLRKPQPYSVPIRGRLESHVHWRVCGANGLLGEVNTTVITGGPI